MENNNSFTTKDQENIYTKPFEPAELNLASQEIKDYEEQSAILADDFPPQSIEEGWQTRFSDKFLLGNKKLFFNSSIDIDEPLFIFALKEFIEKELSLARTEAQKQGERDGWKQGELHGLAIGKEQAVAEYQAELVKMIKNYKRHYNEDLNCNCQEDLLSLISPNKE